MWILLLLQEIRENTRGMHTGQQLAQRLRLQRLPSWCGWPDVMLG
jgi:hypothetical protein